MTFLLILVIVAIGISIYQAGNKKKIDCELKKQTKTNVELQKQLFCDSYKSILTTIEAMCTYRKKNVDAVWDGAPSHETDDDLLIKLVESYFAGRDEVPDLRSESQRNIDISEYKKMANHYRFVDHVNDEKYIDNAIYYSEIPYLERIFLIKHIPKDISKIFFGSPNTSIIAPIELRNELGIPLDLEDEKWAGSRHLWNLEYNRYGELKGVFTNPLSNLIYQICRLRTTKELKKQGYIYSYNNEDSEWQKREKSLSNYNELKSRYPWYFD